ncbi:MAG TPA: hypothetical protein VMH80_03235 [Bryobacteraceae bacterium]|nr:hypothetical protein [Bryobacteraceae bacterium]
MLMAEIHGHAAAEIAGNEDYLTSAVFGYLRFVYTPSFWEAFFSRARGLPTEGKEQSLQEYLDCRNIRFSELTKVEAAFWPAHPRLGTPDVALCFSGRPDRSPFVLIIEAKLWSGKSGSGQDDQLRRYLSVLKSLNTLPLPAAPAALSNATTALLYLTPHESLTELEETSALCNDEPELRTMLFRAQWQDILAAAGDARTSSDRITATILSDVAAFLKTRGLEYFRGFIQQSLALARRVGWHFLSGEPGVQWFLGTPNRII